MPYQLLGPAEITGSLSLSSTLDVGTSATVNGNPVLTSANTNIFVTSVNGVLPTSGNVAVALTAVRTGDSASLSVSSSGAFTGSISDGTLWVISGDAVPANNGEAYIFLSGSISGSWLEISPLDVPAADARYVRQNADGAITGSFTISGSGITIGLLGNTKITQILDTSNIPSINPNTRILKSSIGINILDYENAVLKATVTGSLSGNASTSTSASYATTSSYALFAQSAPGSSPGGNVNTIQYNNGSGGFNGSSGFIFNPLYTSLNHGNANLPTNTYAFTQGTNLIATGIASHAQGNATKTYGNYAHAEGTSTIARAIGSHAEGQNTISSGSYSHAEGLSTIARGAWSHAEGHTTISSGSYSHAEGFNTISLGSYSHAEGYGTISLGSYSHAEGIFALASGSYSHAEGYGTTATGASSHAEGESTTTTGAASHAEGESTTATGDYSHAEGFGSTTIGNYSHAEGLNTNASSDTSHAEGEYTITLGQSSHAEGSYTSASGNYSHAEGGSTIALGDYSHAEGSGSVSSGPYSHAEGEATVALGTGSHAEGNNTIASGSYSHAAGNGARAIGSYSHAEGYYTSASGDYSHAQGENTKALGYGSHAEGLGTIASQQGSHAEGDTTTANGYYSHAEGGGTTATGDYSHAEGYYTIASGFNSHAEGYTTTASGSHSHAEGYNTQAIGNYSHAEGLATIASGSYQHVQGQYNIPSSNTNDLFIIGNGTSNVNRKNILTVSTSSVVVSGSILISGSLIPNTNGVSVTSSFDLGSPTNAWKDIYVSNGTINFLDGAGNVQGTVGAGSAGTVITGSLNVISYGNEELNLENQGYTNGVFTQLPKQRLTSAGIKLAADYSSGLALNAGLYTYFSDPILPWDKKITSFYVYNDLSSSMSPSLLYLPPIYNAPFIPGEIITVYNISPSSSANIKNSGSLKISCFGQGVLGVNTGAKSVTSVLNGQCPILSGSWGNYYSINSSFGYSSSLELLPGKKASFEIFNWGNFSVLTSSNYPFYNGDYSGNGYSESTYGSVYKLISVSDI